VRENSASQTIRQAAVAGDRARRARQARQLVIRWLPVASIFAALAGLILALLSGPRVIAPVLLAVACVSAVALVGSARRTRPLSDRDVLEVDSAAGLGGALRSAHWFATNCDHSSTDPIGAFHLESAVVAISSVDWNRVYVRPPARSALFKTAAGVLGTAVFFGWPALSAPPPALAVDPLKAKSAGAAGSAELPATLVPKLVEGVQALGTGQAPSREALAAIGQALELSAANDDIKRQLEDLLAASRVGDMSAGFWSEPEECLSGEMRACEEARQALSQPALGWAYEDALARAKVAEQQSAARPKPGVSGAEQGTDNRSGDSGAVRSLAESGSGDEAADGQPLLSNARGGATSFSSLLFGRQAAGAGASAGRQGANQARAAALSLALRSEVVHAAADTSTPTVNRGDGRRATTSTDPSAVVGIRASASYDRGRSWQPPAVPDARKTLVHDFFKRAADSAAPSKQP
jgi:hypothetical protein